MTNVDTHVALADLSGFEVEEWGSDGDRPVLTHSCSWHEDIGDGGSALPALVARALAHCRAGCLPPPPPREPVVLPSAEECAAMNKALHDLQWTGHAEMTPETLALIEEWHGPIGWLRPLLDEALAAFAAAETHTDVPPALAARRPHVDTDTCWCNPTKAGDVTVHLDASVPPGHGWVLPRALTEAWQPRIEDVIADEQRTADWRRQP